jgi:hypothetical protein
MKLGPAAAIVLFFRALQHHVYSPDWETAADLRALELCLAAGYDGRKCLRLFDVLEKWFLYYRDFDGVYGLDRGSDEELSPEAPCLRKSGSGCICGAAVTCRSKTGEASCFAIWRSYPARRSSRRADWIGGITER